MAPDCVCGHTDDEHDLTLFARCLACDCPTYEPEEDSE